VAGSTRRPTCGHPDAEEADEPVLEGGLVSARSGGLHLPHRDAGTAPCAARTPTA
jgi:hypothetical protein